MSGPVDRVVAPAAGIEFVEAGLSAAVVLIAAKPWAPGESIEVEVGSEVLDGRVERLRFAPRPDPGWLGSPIEWRAEAAPEAEILPGVSAVVTFGPVGAEAERVVIAGQEVRLRAPTPTWPVEKDSARSAPDAALASVRGSDPMHAWQIELALALAGRTPPARGDNALDLLSEQRAGRWRTALARLAEADSALAQHVASTLGRVISMEGSGVPAWTSDLRRHERLLGALLDEASDDAVLIDAGRAWLADEPRAAAWIIDDGGATRPAVIGVANLSDAAVPATLSASGTVEMAVVEPRSAVRIAIQRPTTGPTSTLEALVGPSRFELALVTAPIPCAPPGVRMGPLLAEWSMPLWLGETTSTMDAAWATGALLQPTPGGEGGWELFVECRAAQEGEDRVRIVFGDPARPSGEFQVDRSGRMEGTGAARGVTGTVSAEPDRWTATLRVPRETWSVDVVTVALERIDARGLRSTWPRRAMPWQTELAGAEIDLTAWGGVGPHEDAQEEP